MSGGCEFTAPLNPRHRCKASATNKENGTMRRRQQAVQCPECEGSGKQEVYEEGYEWHTVPCEGEVCRKVRDREFAAQCVKLANR